MASPSGASRKDGVKCDGIIKKGARRGQRCGKLLLAKDSPQEDPSIACPSSYCGKHKSILALLSEATEVWGDSFRQAALAVLTEEKQEKRSQEMSDSKIKEKRTIVLVNGKGIVLDVEGELLPFAVGGTISRSSRGIDEYILKVEEVDTIWAEDSSDGTSIIRTVRAKLVWAKRGHKLNSAVEEQTLSDKKIYPEKKVVEKDGYRVTVEWQGVFTRFDACVAQAGDCKGKVILKAEGRKWRWGSSIRGRNLDGYDEIYKWFIRAAENKNIRLDARKLTLVLAEALSPYGCWARNKMKEIKKVESI